MFTWDDLKHFLAFARSGSVMGAAKAQGVSQSTVHRRLLDLEERLGRQLIQRHVTGYRLTELGADLLPFAERIEGSVAAFEHHLASSNKELTGVVRVTCSPMTGERLKRTPLLELFQGRFPDLRVELIVGDRYFDLAKGEADIAIRSQGPELEDEALVGRKIAEGAWGVYASRAYVERHGRPKRPEDIARHSVIQCTGALASHRLSHWLRAVAPNATVAVWVDSVPGMIFAAKSGAGLLPLPHFIGDRESDLMRVIDNIPGLVTHFYLLMPRDMQQTPRVRAFFDFVVSEIKAFRAALLVHPEAQNLKSMSVSAAPRVSRRGRSA
jgi:DNA-binding transcriptional LysR family regulator